MKTPYEMSWLGKQKKPTKHKPMNLHDPIIGFEFCPKQLGVGVQGGCEAAVHAIRNFAQTTINGLMAKAALT